MSTPPPIPVAPGSDRDVVRDAARQELRASLLAARATFAASTQAVAAGRSVGEHLGALLAALEPELLGVYWAVRSEFSLEPVLARSKDPSFPRLALPYAHKGAHNDPKQQSGDRSMSYRLWDGRPPSVKDECGIASSDGAVAVPDVVLVPCVGYTRSGYRLGYGGGYFDRWLAAHSHVTAIGVAWSGNELTEAAFQAQAYDVPLALIVTEQGVVD